MPGQYSRGIGEYFFLGGGMAGRGERTTLRAEKGTDPLRPADWGVSEESSLAGGCGPGGLGLP